MSAGRDSDSSASTIDERAGAENDPPTSGSIPRQIYDRVTPQFVRRRLAMKFLVALFLVVVLIGLIGVVTYVQIQGSIHDEASTQLETTAELRVQSIQEWATGMRAQTELIASRDRFPVDGTRSEQIAYLDAAKSNGSDAIVGVHYVDIEERTVLASSRDGDSGRELESDNQWAGPIRALNNAPETSVTTSNQSYTVGKKQAVAFAGRISEDSGIVVVGRFDAYPGTTDNGVRTYLLNGNADGVVPIDSRQTDQLTGVGAFARAVSDGTASTIETGGEVRRYSPIAGTNWIAVSTSETGGLYSVSNTVGRNVLVLIVAALVSLGIVGFVLGRSTVVPLVRLRRRIREIEEGTLDVDLHTTREDEIGRLYQAFESMRDALLQQVQQAQEAKHEAESSRQEMERQNRRLDQFASTLSHDLRNPLAVARGHGELLSSKLGEEQADLHEHVEKVDGAHDRIDSIINDVLTLTRKGESVEETQRFDLDGVAEEAWQNIDDKEATLEIEDSIPIEGDRARLLRALENLFRNAIDHVGPEVTVTVGLTEDGFYVEDDGPGIPGEEMNSIFEYGHTTSEDGTGLGLSIVRTIAEAHGWSLWIDGTSGRGARFVFSDVFESEERIFEESAFTWEHARSDD